MSAMCMEVDRKLQPLENQKIVSKLRSLDYHANGSASLNCTVLSTWAASVYVQPQIQQVHKQSTRLCLKSHTWHSARLSPNSARMCGRTCICSHPEPSATATLSTRAQRLASTAFSNNSTASPRFAAWLEACFMRKQKQYSEIGGSLRAMCKSVSVMDFIHGGDEVVRQQQSHYWYFRKVQTIHKNLRSETITRQHARQK